MENKNCNDCVNCMKRSIEEPCKSCNWERNNFEKYVKPDKKEEDDFDFRREFRRFTK